MHPLLLLLLSCVPANATGLGGDSPPARIPVTARPFTAQFEDRKGTEVEVSQVSFNGEVFIYGNVGAGQVTVPFEKISVVRFGEHAEKDKMLATATLKDGNTVEVVVDDDIVCYGATPYGNYAIETADIRSISFP